MRYLSAAIAILALGACTAPTSDEVNENLNDAKDTTKLVARSATKVVESNASEAVDHTYILEQAIKADIYHTTDTLADWIRPDTTSKPSLPIGASYCYRVQQDILCYRQPMPGGEYRLVGYQGTHAAAPPPPMMTPLPIRPSTQSQQPANRVANAQPVFATPPPEIKDDKKPEDTATPAAVDPTHEQLPNPALAPQL